MPMVVRPVFSILKRVETTDAAVVDPIAKSVVPLAIAPAWIESLAKGDVVPIPTLPVVPIIVRAEVEVVAVPATVVVAR